MAPDEEPLHRGVAQFGAASLLQEGTHSAKIVYSAPMQMLYVYVDDMATPALTAQVTADDLGLTSDSLVCK